MHVVPHRWMRSSLSHTAGALTPNQPTVPLASTLFPIPSALQVGKHSQSSARELLKTARAPHCFEQRGGLGLV